MGDGVPLPFSQEMFTYKELQEVHAFEVDTSLAWEIDGYPKDQIPWSFNSVYYGHLSHAWRQLLVSRGYDANGTPALVLIAMEYGAE
jgi:hypothetical protein